MTIRDAIQDILAGLELGTDPAEVLAEHGFGDVSGDAISSALLHFAERAPLPVADAMAPVVTRVSAVPFADGDLAPLPEADAILAEGGDALAVLNEVGLADPAAALDAPDPGTLIDEVAAGIEEIDDADADDESTFGIGDDDGLPGLDDIEGIEALEDIGSVEDAADAAEDAIEDAFDGLDTQSFTDLFDQASEAAGIDDLEDTDPSDLDLE